MGFDLESFGWGMLVGAIGTVAVGAVITYFAAPYILPVLTSGAFSQHALK